MNANSIVLAATRQLAQTGVEVGLTRETAGEQMTFRDAGFDIDIYPADLVDCAGRALAAKIANKYYDPSDKRLQNLAGDTEIQLTLKVVQWIAEIPANALSERVRHTNYPAHVNNLYQCNLREGEQTELFRQAQYDLVIRPYELVVEKLGDQLVDILARSLKSLGK